MIPYEIVVCVTPPGAPISPYSRIRDAGKAPGILGAHGWRGYDWRSHPTTETDVRRWMGWGANIGILAGRWPGVDIDVDDPALAEALRKHFDDALGVSYLRRSREPRALLMYRLEGDDPVYRQQLMFEVGGDRHMVEILGEGQQYVVHGQHPSGSTYRVDPRIRGTEPLAVTAQQLHDAMDGAQELLELLGAVIVHRGASKGVERAQVDQEELHGPIELVEAAVAVIPNDAPDRESYIAMGYAIKGALGEAGLQVFLGWCERWTEGYNDPETVAADWDRMEPPFEIGAQWLYDRAHRHGWVGDAQDEFEALEGPPRAVERPAGDVVPWSDADLARRLLERHDGELLYVPALGGWMVQSGGVWVADEQLAQDLAGRVCRNAGVDALVEEPNPRTATAVAKMCNSLGARDRALGYASASRQVAAKPEQFDVDPWVLNTPSAVVDLHRGAMDERPTHHRFTRQTGVDLDEGTRPSRWLDFLAESTGGDTELVAYLQRLAGYCLTGSIREHALVFLYGPGGNGKSVFINTLVAVMGSYARIAPMETFVAARGERHPTELAMLAGARLVTAQETKAGRSWDEAKVKSITGGDPISARFMRKDFFTFRPAFKLLLAGNHQPKLDSLDEAWRRRFHLVPFVVKPARIDKQLPDKLLREEGEAILGWAVEGALRWAATGLAAPAAVLDATEQYFEEQDPVGRWLEERCALDPEGFETTADLYDSYRQWAGSVGERTQSQRWLGKELSNRPQLRPGRHADRDNRRKGYHGVVLRSELEILDFGPAERRRA